MCSSDLHIVPNNLPPETASEDGFKNNSELLQMSASQFEAYREIGLKALKRATVIGERPAAVTYIISMEDEMKKAAAAKDAKRGKESTKKPRNQRQLLIARRAIPCRLAKELRSPAPMQLLGTRHLLRPWRWCCRAAAN